MTQNITILYFIHGWTIWHATFFYNIDHWWNEFIGLGRNLILKNCKTITCIIKLEIFPSGMCRNIPHKGKQIHTITFINISIFIWHYNKIHNMLWNARTWFISCRHHFLGCIKWHWRYHKWNCCIHFCYIW